MRLLDEWKKEGRGNEKNKRVMRKMEGARIRWKNWNERINENDKEQQNE